jgi:hypothetical protein
LEAQDLSDGLHVWGVAAKEPTFLVPRQKPDPLLRDPIGPRNFRGVKPLDRRGVVQGSLQHGPKPLDRGRGKPAASNLLELTPRFRGVGDQVVADYIV